MRWKIIGVGVFIDALATPGPIDYPETEIKALAQLQNLHREERRAQEEALWTRGLQAKKNLFANQHYLTHSGKQEHLLLDTSGRGRLEPGGETLEQKSLREGYESVQRAQLLTRQEAEFHELTVGEAGRMGELLRRNSSSLSDPRFQDELESALLACKRKALVLQQEHDEQRCRLELPHDSNLNNELQALKDMAQNHLDRELSSPSHRALLDFERRMSSHPVEKGPKIPGSIFRKGKLAPPPSVQIDKVLPGYLSRSLFQMGIYNLGN